MDRRIDRRALFATGSAAALLAAVGVSAHASPVRGGQLKAALSGGDRGEGWQSVPGGRFLQAARNAVFDTLTEIAADGTLQPGLATAWTAEEGGRVWTFTLRQDVVFHDGTELRAADVVASLRGHGLQADGDTDITVHLQDADPSLPFRMAREGFAVFQQAELEGSQPLMTGTGLYRAVRFEPGRSFIGERVATHRKDGTAGWFDRIELVSVTDENVRAEAVRDGIVDLADLDAAHGLDGHDDIRLITDSGTVGAAVRNSVQHAMRTGPHPLDDLRFVERWWATT
jgi:ABC-type transport system substrate-binding protein